MRWKDCSANLKKTARWPTSCSLFVPLEEELHVFCVVVQLLQTLGLKELVPLVEPNKASSRLCNVRSLMKKESTTCQKTARVTQSQHSCAKHWLICFSLFSWKNPQEVREPNHRPTKQSSFMLPERARTPQRAQAASEIDCLSCKKRNDWACWCWC